MKKVAIICYSYSTIRCDFHELQDLAEHFILIDKENKIARFSKQLQLFFNHIYGVSEFTLENVAPIIKNYVEQYGAEQCALLCCDETILLTVAKLREQFGIPGPDAKTINRFIDKTVMKQFLRPHSIRVPKYIIFEALEYQQNPIAYAKHIENYLEYPMIAKPINLYGSHSIMIIHNNAELLNWAQHAATSDIYFEIDEFIEGKLYHCDALIKNGTTQFLLISEYLWPNGLYALGKPLGSIPLLADDPLHTKLSEFNQQVFLAIKPPDGATHMEVFVTHKAEIVFLEIGARSPGAGINTNYLLSTGINFELEHFKFQLDSNLSPKPKKNLDHHFWCYLPKPQGEIQQRQSPPVTSPYSIEWLVALGSKLESCRLGDKDIIFRDETVAAKLFVHNINFKILYHDFEIMRLANYITVEKLSLTTC